MSKNQNRDIVQRLKYQKIDIILKEIVDNELRIQFHTRQNQFSNRGYAIASGTIDLKEMKPRVSYLSVSHTLDNLYQSKLDYLKEWECHAVANFLENKVWDEIL
jgi:hypothetical protein